MNDLQRYLIRKGAEKLSIEAMKELIENDRELSDGTKEFWIGVLNGYSIASDANDILTILFVRRL